MSDGIVRAHGLMLADCNNAECPLGHILFLGADGKPFAAAELNVDQLTQLMIVLGKRICELVDVQKEEIAIGGRPN